MYIYKYNDDGKHVAVIKKRKTFGENVTNSSNKGEILIHLKIRYIIVLFTVKSHFNVTTNIQNLFELVHVKCL